MLHDIWSNDGVVCTTVSSSRVPYYWSAEALNIACWALWYLTYRRIGNFVEFIPDPRTRVLLLHWFFFDWLDFHILITCSRFVLARRTKSHQSRQQAYFIPFSYFRRNYDGAICAMQSVHRACCLYRPKRDILLIFTPPTMMNEFFWVRFSIWWKRVFDTIFAAIEKTARCFKFIYSTLHHLNNAVCYFRNITILNNISDQRTADHSRIPPFFRSRIHPIRPVRIFPNKILPSLLWSEKIPTIVQTTIVRSEIFPTINFQDFVWSENFPTRSEISDQKCIVNTGSETLPTSQMVTL